MESCRLLSWKQSWQSKHLAFALAFWLETITAMTMSLAFHMSQDAAVNSISLAVSNCLQPALSKLVPLCVSVCDVSEWFVYINNLCLFFCVNCSCLFMQYMHLVVTDWEQLVCVAGYCWRTLCSTVAMTLWTRRRLWGRWRKWCASSKPGTGVCVCAHVCVCVHVCLFAM